MFLRRGVKRSVHNICERMGRIDGKGTDLVSKLFTIRSSRHYHSYPDPNEKPQMSSTVATAESKIGVKKDDISLRKFDMSVTFPGVPESKGITEQNPPPTEFTVLENGLTVASQDVFGQMSSIALIVAAGSAHEVQASGAKDMSLGATQMLEMLAFRSTSSRFSHSSIHTPICAYVPILLTIKLI